MTWTSSNSSIATVNSKGKVTGKAPGTATITATSASGYQANCKVTVQNQPVTRVKLSKTSASLQNGKTVQLKATISPSNAYNKAVKWTSSDESVAKVSASGLVTALKPGTATIRCTAQDGSGKAASCKVTVKKIAVTKVQLTYNGKTAKKLTLSYASEKGKTNTGFAGKALPSNATVQGVTWKSSNSKVISIDAATGAFQVVGVGKATISCIAKDNAKKKASCTITVKKR